MRRLFRRLVFVVLFLALGVLAATFFVDSLVEKGIEAGGHYAVGTEVAVDGVDVGFWGGTFDARDFRIANPKDFSSDPFLSVAKLETEVEWKSLLGEVVTLRRLKLSNIRLRLEHNLGVSNFGVISDNLKIFEREKKPTEGKRFIITEVLLEDVRVAASLSPMGTKLAAGELGLPEIRLQDVGSASDRGATLAELTNYILQAVLGATASQGRGVLPADVIVGLGQALTGFSGLPTQGIKVLDNLSDDVKKLGDQLGGILGGRK